MKNDEKRISEVPKSQSNSQNISREMKKNFIINKCNGLGNKLDGIDKKSQIVLKRINLTYETLVNYC